MTDVIFVQGAGPGSHDEDAALMRSLADKLGDGFSVHFPRMPEDDPSPGLWVGAIVKAVSATSGPLVIVGHSWGGYEAINYLATEERSVAVLCLIASPFPGADADWTFDGFELPSPLRVPPAVFIYASEDDDIVPFAHRDLWAAAIPGALVRDASGGHQLGEDLSIVAADIRSIQLG